MEWADGKKRCFWANPKNPLYVKYHDEEWGVPVHDDRTQFEFLTLEAMQCGLNWNMMLQKREIFRHCFANFVFAKVAAYGEEDIKRILATPGMIRSRSKVDKESVKLFLNRMVGSIPTNSTRSFMSLSNNG